MSAWGEASRPTAAKGPKPRVGARHWLALAAIVAAVGALFIWGAMRGSSPAQTLQRADATEDHGHDLSLYQHRISDLKPKCSASDSQIETWVQNTEALLRAAGSTDRDRLALLVFLDESTSLGQANACDELLAAYAAVNNTGT